MLTLQISSKPCPPHYNKMSTSAYHLSPWPGTYLASFFQCIYGLLWSNGRLKAQHELNYLMLFAAIWLFTVSNLHVALGFQLNLSAFSLEGNPSAYFSKTSSWPNVAKLVTYTAQTVMADSILVSVAVQPDPTSYLLHSCIDVGLSTTRTGKSFLYQSWCGFPKQVCAVFGILSIASLLIRQLIGMRRPCGRRK